MIPLRSIEDLWPFVEYQCSKEPALWELLHLDVAGYLELQRVARASGLGGPWRDPKPGEPMSLESRRLLEQHGYQCDRDGKVVLGDRPVRVQLPDNGREPAPEPPRRRAGAPEKLSNDVLRQSLRDHPKLAHRQRARMLTEALGLQDRPLHKNTIASRLRALKKL